LRLPQDKALILFENGLSTIELFEIVESWKVVPVKKILGRLIEMVVDPNEQA